MCPPDFYGIEYEINPWMSRSRGSDRALAVQQWEGLVGILQQLGARIDLVSPKQGLPDLVFTANAGLVFKNCVYPARFRHEERSRETPVYTDWFANAGFEVRNFPDGMFHEGAGDALFCGDALFAGYRFRSDVNGHQWLARDTGVRVLPLELIDPYYYHLDTCFCPLAPGVALYFPDAFDEYGKKVLAANVPKLIAVEDAEAKRFGCNAVVVGKSVVVNTGCPNLIDQIESLGYSARATPLDEFLKAGGSAKCLTLRLDGEEAASWAR